MLPVGQRPTFAICEHCWKEFQLTVEGDAHMKLTNANAQNLRHSDRKDTMKP